MDWDDHDIGTSMTRTRLRPARLLRSGAALPRTGPATAALLAGVLALAGCAGGGGGPDQPDGADVAAVILEPANATTDVITAAEIVFTTENAVDTTLGLAELDGTTVDGELSEDRTRWRPASQLAYQTTYVATLTAVGADGENAITISTFTTMAEPDQTIRVFSFLGSEAVVGVGMPLRIEFKDDGDSPHPIPEEHRAEVEQRMSVRSDPPQEGVWHWVSGAEVHFRPMEFWQPGTQIHYRLATGGLPVGESWYLRNDLNVNLSVGGQVLMEVDNLTRQMTVTVDGEVARTIPVSLGRSDFPSSSGTFVIMEKLTETVFDTRAELGPEEGYVVDIEYAMRLTYRGEFMHATVRSGEELGAENVTHGCINMARDNAEWLFGVTHRWGDPVIIEGTTRQAELGNGWTDWNQSWEEYQQGSALAGT
jgi:lipoprotein-anchoring transpeptidase ErfK/SrfK